MKKDVAASAAEAVAPKKPEFFPDRRGFAQVADIHHPRGKGDARCRFGGDLRVFDQVF